MAYDRDSFLAGVAVGRNMLGWPEMHGVGKDFFAFTIKIETAPFDYSFYGRMYDCAVTWGDGTSEIVPYDSGSNTITHTYNVTGVFQVKVLGRMTQLRFGQSNGSESARRLISVDTPFPEPYHTIYQTTVGLESLFKGCQNLEHFPNNLFVNIAASGLQIDSLRSAFADCQKLTRLPKKLFKGLTITARDISYLFGGCTSLTVLPEDLFSNPSFNNVLNVSMLFTGVPIDQIPFRLPFTSATSANGIFYACPELREVREDLFSECTNLQTVNGCFSSSGIESIPGNLFSQNTQLKVVSSAFSSTIIKSVPSGLFNNLPLLEDASSCFENCNQLITIQDAPFYGCPNLYDLEQCFYNCYRLQSVPSSLFSGLPSYAVFRECFDSCRAITSPVPELWEQYTTSRRNYCFYGCANAANYSDIPSNWR